MPIYDAVNMLARSMIATADASKLEPVPEGLPCLGPRRLREDSVETEYPSSDDDSSSATSPVCLLHKQDLG